MGKGNKNPNRPKGRGIFNVSDTQSDNGELMQNNPTAASSGVSETNERTADGRTFLQDSHFLLSNLRRHQPLRP